MFLLMFMTSELWHFLVVVTGCMEQELSCFRSTGFGCLFLYSYFAADCLRHVGPTHQEDLTGPNFLKFSRGSCSQRELLMVLYKWGQLKFKDGALVLNRKDSFCTGGLKKLPRIAGRSYSLWHPFLVLGAAKGKLLFRLQLGSKPSLLCHKEGCVCFWITCKIRQLVQSSAKMNCY